MTDTPTEMTEPQHTLTDIELGHICALQSVLDNLETNAKLFDCEAERCRIMKNEGGEEQAYRNSDILRNHAASVKWAINKLEALR